MAALDALFGRTRARRIRVGSAGLIALLLLGGCALFLFESQTFGRVALVLGLAWALFWIGLRYIARTGEAPGAAIKRRRGVLVGVQSQPLASPMDGPPFGDTGPT
jgi:hypothetical protein